MTEIPDWTGCLTLGCPLNVVYEKHVLANADIAVQKQRAKEDLEESGLSPVWRSFPKLVPVRFEGRNFRGRRWILWNVKSISYSRAKGLYRTISEQIANPLNESGQQLVVDLIEQLRNGNWIARGTKEPPTHELDRTEIPAEWWSRPDSFISFQQNSLYRRERRGREREWIKTFSDIVVNAAQPENAIRPNSSLLDAVDALADPADREFIFLARHGTRYDFGGGLLILGAPEDPDEKRGSERHWYFIDLDERLRSELVRLAKSGHVILSGLTNPFEEPKPVPADRVEFLEFNFEESTVALQGSAPLPVRVSVNSERSKGGALQANSVAIENGSEGLRQTESRKPGRPSRKPEIVAAYNTLLERREISRSNPMKELVYRVRDQVLLTSADDDVRALSEETIRRTLRPLVKAETSGA